MLQGVIFDLDGTLLNTLPTIAYYGNRSLSAHGLQEIDQQAYRYMVGDGAVRLVKRMISYAGGTDADFDAVYADYMLGYAADTNYLTKIYDGIDELLLALQQKGLKMAVLSNKPQEQLDGVIKGFFPDVPWTAVIGSSPEIPKKPDPYGVSLICQQWKLFPEECLYLGDTATDMLTGRGAGCYTIGAAWGFRSREELSKSGASKIISHPMETLEVLL